MDHTATLLLAVIALACLLHSSAAGTAPQCTCSCLWPASVPLANAAASPSQGVLMDNKFYAAAAPSPAEVASAAAASAAALSVAAASSPYASAGTVGPTMQATVPSSWTAVTSGVCGMLPSAERGEHCGAGIAICKPGYCCSQAGTCSKSAVACDGTCQCPYSGVGSNCTGAWPLRSPNPALLPVAEPGGVCSPYTAVAGPGQCCTQFGITMPDTSPYCLKSSCKPFLSPWSQHCLLPSQSNVPIRRFRWVVSAKQLAPDGFTRSVIVVNGNTMEPLTASVGNRIVLTVTNKLTEPLSLHFHGMLQRGTNTMDGVDGTTQRPVQPGETFTYNFMAETAGSCWWHSHHHTQYMDGLWGPLVVTDPKEAQFAADNVVALSDWYHTPTTLLMQQYMSPASQGNEPVPYDALINFKGQGDLQPAALTKVSSYSLVKGVAAHCDAPRTAMARLRILNAGGFAVFRFSVDKHRLIVIAQDAVLVEPLEVGSLEINNGQRYDVLVCQRPLGGPTAVSTSPVFIRGVMIDDNFPSPSTHNSSQAILFFTKVPPTKVPSTTDTPQPPHMSQTMVGPDFIHPYSQNMIGRPVPPPNTTYFMFDIAFYNEPPNDPNATQYAHVNGVALNMMPEVPCLLERFSSNPEGLGPPASATQGMGWQIISIADAKPDGFMPGEVVQVVINNYDEGEHPIHLHGHWFFIMAAGAPGDGPYSSDIPLAATLARDTVMVNAESYLVLRFVADNPGLQIMHCHIDWHMAAGLGLLIKEGFPGSALPPPP